MLNEEKVFLEYVTVVLMKIMSSEVISDAEGQMVREGVPFFGQGDGLTFAEELEEAIERGPMNIADIYCVDD